MEPKLSENILNAADSETVCWCSKISKREILDAKANGASTIEEIRKITGACTLGRCKEISPRGRCCSKEIIQLLAADTTTKERL